jgi:hypothetical protein
MEILSSIQLASTGLLDMKTGILVSKRGSWVNDRRIYELSNLLSSTSVSASARRLDLTPLCWRVGHR